MHTSKEFLGKVLLHKSFEIIREHFDLQYDNVPCWYFIHNDYILV